MKWKRRKVAKKRRAWRKFCEKVKTADPTRNGRFHHAEFAIAV